MKMEAEKPLETHALPVRAKVRGHFRSSSLENNTFLSNKHNLTPNFTGTLKSRKEQKLISDYIQRQAQTASAASLSAIHQNDLNSRKAHFENIREIFEKKRQSYNQMNGQQNTHTSSVPMVLMSHTDEYKEDHFNVHQNSNCLPEEEETPPQIQSFSGVLGKGKQLIRPIAFKPVPYKPNTSPNFGGRFSNELSERYGSTPSLVLPINAHHRFGSTTELSQNHYQYGIFSQKTPSISSSISSSIPFKTYDSLESVLKLPESMTQSLNYPCSGKPNEFNPHDLDMTTPSPSDSGTLELERELRDRDSELAYLRQTMEHNEQVIFKVHQDKERHWEQELGRLKAIHENRLRAGAQKVHKLEQLLMMQTFQLRQDKKRLIEDTNRLHDQLNQCKEQNEHNSKEMCHLKIVKKDLEEQNCDLVEEIQMLRRIVSDLKGRLEEKTQILEESEWNLCQRNGELALIKSQLKDSQNEIISRDQEIVILLAELKSLNWNKTNNQNSEIQKDIDNDLQLSQLNRILTFKDQVIVAINNEVQRLRKELSDISLSKNYEGSPTGRSVRNAKMSFKPDEDDGDNKCQKLNEDEICDISLIVKNVNNMNNNLKSCDNQIPGSQSYCVSNDICINCSDEDKTQILNLQNIKNLPDITLNLNCDHLQERLDSLTYTAVLNRGYSSNSNSSEDDFKSLTPSQEDNFVVPADNNEQCLEVPLAPTTEISLYKAEAVTIDAESEADNLKVELEASKQIFEEERIKWAEEKEKVLVYQRQLQNNYVEILKRTQELEDKLLVVNENMKDIGDSEVL